MPEMDTDSLTPMAYDCIRLADAATDVLKFELGAACSQYRDEDDYLRGILEDVKDIEEDPDEYLDQWNVLQQCDVDAFVQSIRTLREHIEKTIDTPILKRGEPTWKR